MTFDDSKAVNIVARQIVHYATEDGGNVPQWEDWPEIGERDWFAILAEVHRIAEAPNLHEFNAAYTTLKARANRDSPIEGEL